MIWCCLMDARSVTAEATNRVVIDASDPLLGAFALQHDIRERFLVALEIIATYKPEGRRYKDAFLLVQEVAKEAMDPEKMEKWIDAGRPLPTIDNSLGDVPRSFTKSVTDFLRETIETGDR